MFGETMGWRGLIVEDEENQLAALRDLLSTRLPDLALDTASDALSATELLSQTNYQVVISESSMPQGGGRTRKDNYGLQLIRDAKRIRPEAFAALYSADDGILDTAREEGVRTYGKGVREHPDMVTMLKDLSAYLTQQPRPNGQSSRERKPY